MHLLLVTTGFSATGAILRCPNSQSNGHEVKQYAVDGEFMMSTEPLWYYTAYAVPAQTAGECNKRATAAVGNKKDVACNIKKAKK